MVHVGKVKDPKIEGRFWEVHMFLGGTPGTVDFIHMSWGSPYHARIFKFGEAEDNLEQGGEELVLLKLDVVEFGDLLKSYVLQDFCLVDEGDVQCH